MQCFAVKLKMIQNLIDNIKDQNYEEYASAFGFKRLVCSKAKRIEYLRKVFSIYGKNYPHEAQKIS